MAKDQLLNQWLVLKATEEFRLSQDVTLHGALEVGFRGSSGELRWAIKRVEPEGIAMSRSRRRARAAIANPAEVVDFTPLFS